MAVELLTEEETQALIGGVTFLNPVAPSLTDWTQADAAGTPLDIVFGCDPPRCIAMR